MKTPFDLIVKRAGKAVCDYHMIKGGDRIAVGISGGKDSLTLYLVLKELKRKAREKFDLIPVYLSITENGPRDALMDFFRQVDDELKWFPTQIFKSVDKMIQDRPGESPCRLCSRFRRAALYDRIQTLGCNKLALGHHMDDMVETFMLNMFFAGKPDGMPPAAKAQKHDILMIRPLIYSRESLIVEFSKHSPIPFPEDSCCALLPDCKSMRQVVKEWVGDLREINDKVLDNAFAALKKADFFSPVTYKGEITSDHRDAESTENKT